MQLRVTLSADVCQGTKPSRSNDTWLAKQHIWRCLCACCLRDRQVPKKPVQLGRCNSQSKHSSSCISVLQRESARLWWQIAFFAVGSRQGCIIGACLSAFVAGASTLATCQGLKQLCCIPERTCHAYADLRERATSQDWMLDRKRGRAAGRMARQIWQQVSTTLVLACASTHVCTSLKRRL